MKTCATCNETKPVEAFHLHKSMPGGRAKHCAVCLSAKARYLRSIGHVPVKRSKPSPLKGVPRRSLEERFWAKVDKRGPDECWLWTGSKNNYGYGMMYIHSGRENEQAHRIALMIAGVPLPDRKKTGFVVDHACRNILCVNVRHLRIVPHLANVIELADRSRVGERQRIARALGRGELRRKRRPEDDVMPEGTLL